VQEWQELGCAERFEWCLVDGVDEIETGIGATESMPYADEVLVLIPTIDVRLIEAKVPLANAKKLHQILPNLIEEYVLTGAQALSVQALPPVPGKPAVQRVIALSDRAWFTWLTKQLENLISQRVRLVPECFLLPVATEGIEQIIAYQREEGNVLFTQRTAEQLGVSWVERLSGSDDVESVALPSL
jgi:type II secretory pathway component PulL